MFKYIFALIFFLNTFNTMAQSIEKPYHHIYKDGKLFAFRNPEGGPQRNPNFKWKWKVFSEEKKKLKINYPPEHVIDKQDVLKNLESHKSGSYVMWLDHASFIIKLGDTTIITDPVFEKNYGPLWFGPKKYVESPLTLKELPEINLFLLTHNHYDHMSIRTIKNFPYKNAEVLVPLKLGKYFTRNGYKKDKVKEMDWFDTIKINDDLKVTMIPAQHWSKRWIWGDGNTDRSLWGSFLIEYKGKKIFFACDTGPAPFYKDLGEKFGPIDLGFGNIGAYNFFPIINEKDKSVFHANPEELLSLMQDLKVKKVIGMHWGTAILSLEPIWEPPVRFKANAEKFGYNKKDAIIFKIGEVRELETLLSD